MTHSDRTAPGRIPPFPLLAASAAALALLGCGGGGNGTSFVPVPAATNAPAPAPAPSSGGTTTIDTTPQPTIAKPAGPLALVPDSSAAFSPPDASATQYQKHLSIATANAGAGTFATPAAPGNAAYYNAAALRRQWCYTAENASSPPELQDRAVLPPIQMFDNVWAFGPRWVLQYGFLTGTGKSFLLDALNNTAEAQAITEPGLVAMGTTGAQLAAIMPTHGHGDHYGGAGYLQQKYGTPVYLGSADAAVGARGVPPFTVTQFDSANLQPVDVDFGGLKATVLSTPGHTAGTMSGVLPVKLAGKDYKLVFWGGTGMPNTLALAQQYLDGAERLYRLAAAQKVDGTLHTHPFVDGSLSKLDALLATPALRSNSNPFLVGTSLALRSLSILRECSAAKVAQLDATAVIPAWHTTTTDLSVTAAGQDQKGLQLTATVRNPYGALRDAVVKFSVAPQGATCTAATDAKGQASCLLPAVSGVVASVNASFDDAALADGSLQLGSTAALALR